MVTTPQGQRLIAGQVEQVRDPRLQGLPFCIKQKHIVVTASYPARKLGVKKLQLWTEAKKTCPDLITIVGEVCLFQAYLMAGLDSVSTCK
jgi:nucleotidyltransferase/DNA polymerase involved in DNA repair